MLLHCEPKVFSKFCIHDQLVQKKQELCTTLIQDLCTTICKNPELTLILTESLAIYKIQKYILNTYHNFKGIYPTVFSTVNAVFLFKL